MIDLLQVHLAAMHAQSPPESTHALDVDTLKDASITFLSAWDGETLLGVGALKRLSETHGEIKSMHTAQIARGRGVARALLAQLEQLAHKNGLTRLSLETGTPSEFEAARIFYERAGYETCPPFGDYVEDPYSVFMTKRLD